jgi:hypothetical protein
MGPVQDVLAAFATYKAALLAQAGPALNDNKRHVFGFNITDEDKDRLTAAGVPLEDGFVLDGTPVGSPALITAMSEPR